MLKRILALVCALLLTASALSAVNIDYTLFGEALHINPPSEEQFFLTYEGEKYSLLDDCARFDEAFSIYGGKSRAVYEYTLPQGSFSIDDGSELPVGRMTIDVPARAQLTVLEGNRRSGEYAVIESRELTDVYVDEVLLPRGENGAPLLMDRIYLYTYEIAGETRRMAATLFFDYEGYTAGYGTAMPSIEQTIGGFRSHFNRVFAASALFILVIWIALLVIFLRLRKKKAASVPAPAAEPAPENSETLTAGRELLENIRSESLLIGDAEISERTDSILQICTRMLNAADEQPAKAPQLRKFLNYYLPTLLKLLSSLNAVQRHGVSDAEVAKMRASALHGLDMVLTACRKQLDNLYRDEMLDISADVDVLEQMLVRDGFAESELDKVRSRFNHSDN